MRNLRLLCTCCVLASAGWGAGVQAQTLQPGLWEFSTQMQGAQADQMAAAMEKMQKQMASMPAEQRKMMEDMMAKRGMQIGTDGNGGMSTKICMTPEMVERNMVGHQGDRGECSHTMAPRSGNSMKFSFVCSKPPSSGEGEVTFLGRDSFTQHVTVTTTVKGQPQTVEMQSRGKWLGADCGNIKPLAIPTK